MLTLPYLQDWLIDIRYNVPIPYFFYSVSIHYNISSLILHFDNLQFYSYFILKCQFTLKDEGFDCSFMMAQ